MSNQPMVPNLSSDRPISSLSEDVFGRGGFAVSLANAFIQWRGDDSLVVALYGPWGSGKSSLKNMVLELIRRDPHSPAIVEFNPWVWSGRDRLFSAFFEEVGIAIGRGDDPHRAKSLASMWRKYGARLSLAGSVFSALNLGALAIGAPGAGIGLGVAAAASNQSSELADKAANAHEAATQDEPLNELKRSLSHSLKGLKAPLMVVMDDVDRLTEEEVRLLFQLIKVNADFPMVVYFLLFDRTVIERALDGEGGSTGRDYMEKIVQVGFDLPKQDPADLERIVSLGLNKLLNFEGADRTFDSERWSELSHYVLQPILDTPRDVNRFLSSISFTIGLYYREQDLEVNVIDMIGIEALRIFEPDLYHQLSAHKELLLGSSSTYQFGTDDREERRGTLDLLIEHVSKANRTAVEAALRQLFPSIDWLLKGSSQGRGYEAGWVRSLRICHEDFFHRYFAQSVPSSRLTVSMFSGLLSVRGDREAVRTELTNLRGKGLLIEALGRLLAYSDEIDLECAIPFVTAIMDVGDSLPELGEGMFDVNPYMKAYFVISDILKRVEDPVERSRIIMTSLKDTNGLFLPVRIVSLDRRSRGEPPLLDDRSLAVAKKLCVAKLTNAAMEGRLVGSKLGTYLWDWNEISAGTRDAGLRRYIASLVSTIEGTLIFVRAFTSEYRTSISDIGSTRTSTRVNFKVNPSDIERFLPFATIKSKLKPLLGGKVPSEFVEIAAEYQKELEAVGRALDPEHDDPFDLGFASKATPIDLNEASLHELVDLPGISTELASRIIAARPYKTVDHIKIVNGIGVKRLSRIRGLVKVEVP